MQKENTIISNILHYPSIEFFDDTWLKACLCIWDKVYRIVPESYRPKDSDEVKYAIDKGLVENINLDKNDLEKAAEKFQQYWEKVPFPPAGAEKRSEEYSRLHIDKVDVKIRPQLEALSKIVNKNGWLRLTKSVANLYMLFLSETVSERRNIPKLTPDEDMFTVMHYFQNHANFSETTEDPLKEEITAAIVLPAVLPKGLESTDIKLILDYRLKNEENRLEFRKIIETFTNEISQIKEKKFAQEQKQNFVKRILENRMSFAQVAKESILELPYALVSIGLPTTLTAISTICQKETDPFNFFGIGASCMIGAVASIADVGKSVRKKWNCKKSNYLVGLNKVTSSSDGLRFKFNRYNRLFDEFIND